ncbi:MAG: antitoxin [Deltaproteobacteria bacterium]|nr:antitoxin [Deltaproteobacteria bacterium]
MRKSANDEKQLLDSFERGEWKPAAENERRKYADYAKATLRKDRRVNIRISERDLRGLQERALEEGVPYQTLMSSVLHKYASGRLKEAKTAPD